METYGYSIRRLEKTVDAETFVRNYVDIPKIAGYCAECSEYGKNWSCPAYKFHTEDLWKRFKEHSDASPQKCPQSIFARFMERCFR